MSNRLIQILYRLVLLAAVIYGLILSIFFPQFSIDKLPALTFFTVQSNLLVALFLIYTLVYPCTISLHTILRGSVLIAIAVTGLLFHLFLVPFYPELFANGLAFRHHLTHTIAPIGFIIDWLLFDRKGQINRSDLKYWLIYPAIYWIFSMVRGSFVGAYPYFFMDPGILETGSILLWSLLLMFIFTVLGLLLIGLDKILNSEA